MTNFTITSDDDKRIGVTIHYNTISRYKNGSQSELNANVRHWVIKRDGDKFLIESF